jgi:hypothetical protein
MRNRIKPALIMLLFLSACGDGPSEVGPGGVSAEDARALDAAAAKLDAEVQAQPETNAPSKN